MYKCSLCESYEWGPGGGGWGRVYLRVGVGQAVRHATVSGAGDLLVLLGPRLCHLHPLPALLGGRGPTDAASKFIISCFPHFKLLQRGLGYRALPRGDGGATEASGSGLRQPVVHHHHHRISSVQ